MTDIGERTAPTSVAEREAPPPAQPPVESALAVEAAPPTPAQRVEGLVANNNLQPEQRQFLETDTISPEQVEQITQLVEQGHFQVRDIQDLAAFDAADLKNELEYLNKKRGVVDRLVAQGQIQAFDRKTHEQMTLQQLEAITQENPQSPEETAEALQEIQPQTPAQAASKETLQVIGKNGQVEKTVTPIFQREIQGQFDAALLKEAQLQFAQMTTEERQQRNLKDLPEDQFLEAYIAQQKANPDYMARRDKEMAAELEKKVNEYMEGVKDKKASDAIQELSQGDLSALDKIKAKLKQIKEEMREYGVKLPNILGENTIEVALDLDFATFLRFLTTAESSLQFSRSGGGFGMEDEQRVRYISLEEFQGAAKRPKDFGESLVEAAEEKELVEAGFTVLESGDGNSDLLKRAKSGEVAAIKAVFTQLLEHLFDQSVTPNEAEKRWKVFRKVIPEAIFSNIYARFDDKMKEQLKQMHETRQSSDGELAKLFPIAAASSAPSTPAPQAA